MRLIRPISVSVRTNAERFLFQKNTARIQTSARRALHGTDESTSTSFLSKTRRSTLPLCKNVRTAERSSTPAASPNTAVAPNAIGRTETGLGLRRSVCRYASANFAERNISHARRHSVSVRASATRRTLQADSRRRRVTRRRLAMSLLRRPRASASSAERTSTLNA